MKSFKTPLFIFTLVIAVAGCDKDNDNSSSLEGNWELRSSQASITPATTFPAGNGKIIKFTSKTFEIYDGPQLLRSGQYELKKDGTVRENTCKELDPQKYNRIIVFDGKTDTTKQFFRVDGNKLHLVSGCAAVDAQKNAEYERIN